MSQRVKESAEKCATRRRGFGSEDDKGKIPPNFYDWKRHFPQLKVLLDNIEILIKEMKAANSWQLWPEDLYDRSKGEEWRVFPFLHTFPAYDKSKMEWVEPNCKQCPHTVKLLKSLPGIRTALYVVFFRKTLGFAQA